MRRIALAGVVVLATLPFAAVRAQPPPRALHNIPWYSAHPAERAATLRLCHTDYSYSGLPDCANAEAAGAGQAGSGSSIGKLKDMLKDPQYWRENRVARWAEMAQCRRGDRMALPYCAAAVAGGGDGP